MYEQTKIDEANYFLGRMNECLNNPKIFCFELSAFLSAARSILQYALKEAVAQSHGQAWYDSQVCGNAEIRFFKDKRDASIHVKPVAPTINVNVSVTEVVQISESISVKLTDRDERVIGESTISSPALSPIESLAPCVSYSYTFPDWPGTDDALALCSRYLAAVETAVVDGITKGLLRNRSTP